ncbi:hypothetical protein NKW54_08510 [Acetobacter cerevisiae]|uniref:Uncharacterized protein n=1 Tax=Acetobacter cerevisiae TaxID=178900 RepID=A0ABT1EVM1_9PROT|nr:hypothetical protein [Acetobacter cerevisiae]MCP1245980.1 hypothetical protein [Acetobacter cerevisiae]MCP1255698.1 hypothetical protein [Acetobacter cerevisiae]
MAKRTASSSPFAHLASANAQDDDDKNKSKAKAEGEQEDEDGEEEEGENKNAKSKRARSKKAKADCDGAGDNNDDDDGDTEDEEDEKDDQAKAARSRERARCAAIFASPAAARNLPAAAHLAFNTPMPRSQAVGLLGTLAPAETALTANAKTETKGLRDRMQASPFGGVKPEGNTANAVTSPGARLVAAQAIRKGGN